MGKLEYAKSGTCKCGAPESRSDCKKRGQEIRLMSVKEAALYLATTPATLYTRIWRREVPFIKLGRSVRFDVRDLDELIEQSKVKPRELRWTRGILKGS